MGMKLYTSKLQCIEIFAFFVLTVGPLDPIYKIIGYIILLLFNVKYLEQYRFITIVPLALIISMIIPMILDILNVDSTTSYSRAGFAYLLPFIFCLIYTKKYEEKEFLQMIEKVAFTISAISIIGYVIMIYAPAIIEQFPSVYFYGRRVYTILLFGAIRDYSGEFLMRNCGIAFEPGAFQFVCNLGFALYLSEGKQINNSIIKTIIRYIVYILAVMSTQSTTGLVILACILVINMVRNKKSIFFVFVIIAVFSSTIAATYTNQVEKLNSGNIESRFGNTIYVLKTYGDNIFGIGSTGYDKIYAYDNRIGSWDTYSNLYLRFGLPFLIIFIGMNIRLLKLNKSVFVVVTLTLLTESLVGPITIILYYLALQERGGNHYESIVDMQSS